MSRWIDNFNSHAFQGIWQQLKDEIDATKIDDETVITDVAEFARLRKVIGYIDGMIQSIDPELVPPGTWDSFRDQANNCYQQLTSYRSNRNIGHITNANGHADNLLTYIRPYMVVDGELGIALNKAINAYAETITNYADSFCEKSRKLLDEINQLKDNAIVSSQAIDETKQSIDRLNVELFGENSDDGLYRKIKELAANFEEKYEAIKAFHHDTLIGDENNFSTKKELSQAKDSALADQKSINELLVNAEQKISELENFHAAIFGELKGDNQRTGGRLADFNARVDALKAFETEQKAKYKTLNDEIETLLPGATSAGLASAYSEMKNSFEKPIKNATRLFFYSIGVMILGTMMLSIEKISPDMGVTFVAPTDWDSILRSLVYKIPFFAPILWLAFYATKRRSEYHRLQQEYSHKEAFAKSYHNYKLQLQDLQADDGLQIALIKKAIDAIAYNASQTLDKKHGDKMPVQEMIEKTVDKSISAISNIKKGEPQ